MDVNDLRHCDLVLVGAGAIGMLSALTLAREGLRVGIIDQGAAGREASWAGGGILSPLHPWRYPEPVMRLARYGMTTYGELAKGLHDATGIDPEWEPSGILLLDSPGRPIPDHAARWAAAWGFRWVSADGDGTALKPPFAWQGRRLWCPDVAQIRNPRLLKALQARVRQLGIPLLEHVALEGITARGGRLQALETSQGAVPVARAVITAGAWTGRLLERAGVPIPVRPVRGQMLLLQGPPGLLPHMVLQGARYLVPRRDGMVLVGSTSEDVGFDKGVTEEARKGLLAFAHEAFPPLAALPVVGHWAGLRPGSGASLPYIGPVPGMEGLYASAGHFRYGLTNAPASAELLADWVLGRSHFVDPAPYLFTAPRTEPLDLGNPA